MMKDSQMHILIVDDNEDILSMFKVMLEYKGYKVSVRVNSNNIKEVIKDVQPNIIIMDMLLSGSDGCEICKELKAEPLLALIPVIMISAHPQAKTQCLQAGADFFIEKPFEMNDFLQTLTHAVNNI